MVTRRSITKEVFAVIFLTLLSIFFVYVYKSALSSEQKIFQQIKKEKINRYQQVFENFTHHLITYHNIKTKKELFDLFSDPKKRNLYENTLSILNTDEVKYIYLLQKDKRGRFRFLLDASKDDKAHFYQKFDVKGEAYKKIYKTHEPQIINQTDIKNLYLTYLYPILANKETIAIISADISTKFKKDISDTMVSFKILFRFLIILIFLVAVVTAVYVFYYYLSRKKLFTDPLTKVFNRNYFDEIKSSLHLNNYSIAMFDLDRFKVINDTYGHSAGDYVLQESANILKNSLRDNDIVIRFGGEEFLVFLYIRGDIQNAINICERIRKNIEQKSFIFENQEILVTTSIGLNTKPTESKNINEAIKLADTKLYIAKNSGRNKVIFSIVNEDKNLMDNRDIKDIDFVKEAINDNRVVCYFQPIYDAKNDTIIKYEALVRIIDTDGSLIAPFLFLPNIEHTNIHIRLTKEIFHICFEIVKKFKRALSININYSDLINKDIENIIVKNLKDDRELASNITFEILESDEIKNLNLFIEKIKLVHSLGATISIDDFGSGYSNFKTILDMDANYLKIDGTLIKNIDKDEKCYKVVKNIIKFAKDTKLKTVAEFVHSKEVYDKLIELEIDFMQGYYISEPKAKLIDETQLNFKL